MAAGRPRRRASLSKDGKAKKTRREGKSPRKPARPTEGGNRGGSRSIHGRSPRGAPLPPLAGENGLVRLGLGAQLPGPSLRAPSRPRSRPMAAGGTRRWRSPVALPGRGWASPGRVGPAAEQGRGAAGQRMLPPYPHHPPRRPLTAPAGLQEPPEAPGQHNATAVWGALPPPGLPVLPAAVRWKQPRGAQAEGGGAPFSPHPASTCHAARRSPSASGPAPRASAGHGGGCAAGRRPDPAGRSALPGDAIAAARRAEPGPGAPPGGGGAVALTGPHCGAGAEVPVRGGGGV